MALKKARRMAYPTDQMMELKTGHSTVLMKELKKAQRMGLMMDQMLDS